MPDLPRTAPPQTKAAEPALAADAAAACDPKRIDWKNRDYPPSKLSSKPFKLTNGLYKFNVKKVDPATNLGNEETGDAYSLGPTEFGDFDGDGTKDGLLGFYREDFGVFHGNRPAQSLPWFGYVYHLSPNLRAGARGHAIGQAGRIHTQCGRKARIAPHQQAGAKRREYHIEAGKLELLSEGQIDQRAFDGYLAPVPQVKCDEARVRAGLPSDPKAKPRWSGAPLVITDSDPCIGPRLQALLGKRAKAFSRNAAVGSQGPKSRRRLLDRHGLPCPRVHDLPLGVRESTPKLGSWTRPSSSSEGRVITATNNPPDELKAVVEELRQATLNR